MKARILLVVSLVLAGVLVWAIARSGPGAPASAAPAPSLPTPAPAPAEAHVAAPDAPSHQEPRTTLAKPARDGLRVRVVDAEKRAVAGATIEVRGEDDEIAFPPTDSDGRSQAARMPLGSVWLQVHRDGRSGAASWNWSALLVDEVTIVLMPDRDVEVTVTDRAGAPWPDAQVGLFGVGETDWSHSSVSAATGSDGVARFHLDGGSWLALNRQVRAVATLYPDRVPTELSAWAESGPTRFSIAAASVAPAVGPELLVRFVDRDGAPIDVKGTLSWSRIETMQGGTLEGPAGEQAVAGRQARITLLDGDHVRLHLDEADRLDSTLELTLPPGARAHETTLARGLPKPRVEIPLVDGKGQPVVTGDYVVTVLPARGYEIEHELHPDAAGVLAVALDEAGDAKIEVAEKRRAARFIWPPAERVKRPYRTTLGGPAPTNPPLAIVPIAPGGPGQVLRLPPVVVPDVAPRIVGRVVDADGAPVSGVRILMTTVTVPEPKEFADFATKTDSAGRFEICATALPDEVFVLGRRPLAFCAPVRVRPSSEPVTLHLQPTGVIAVDARKLEYPGVPEDVARQLWPGVKLHIDDAALAAGWWAFYRDKQASLDASWRGRWWTQLALPEQGGLLFRDLVPNVYGVQAIVGLEVDLDVTGVRVDAGATVRPPQLQDVVLGTSVEPGRVHVHDAAGAGVANARVAVQLPEWKAKSPHPQAVATDSNGDAWFVVPRGAVAAIGVVAAGCAPLQFASATFPLDVVLGAGTSLDFTVRGHDEVARNVRALVVACQQFRGTPPASPIRKIGAMESLPDPQASVGSDGRCTIPNLAPGSYRLWLAAVPPIASQRGRTFVLLQDRTITAADPAHVAIEHALTADEVRTLLGQ